MVPNITTSSFFKKFVILRIMVCVRRAGWCVLEAAVLKCYSKFVYLKISQISQEDTCAVV